MDKAKIHRIIKIVVLHLLGGAIVAAIVLFSNGFCLFKAVTGIDCLGCGLTRAYLAFFNGDLKSAVAFHPMFWAVPIMFGILGHICPLKKHI